MMKIPFKNEISTYNQLNLSSSNQLEIEYIEQLVKTIDFAHNIFEQTYQFLVKVVNIAKYMTSRSETD